MCIPPGSAGAGVLFHDDGYEVPPGKKAPKWYPAPEVAQKMYMDGILPAGERRRKTIMKGRDLAATAVESFDCANDEGDGEYVEYGDDDIRSTKTIAFYRKWVQASHHEGEKGCCESFAPLTVLMIKHLPGTTTWSRAQLDATRVF
jgi:hypothetical protein